MGKKFSKHQQQKLRQQENKIQKQEENSFDQKYQQKEIILPKRSVEQEEEKYKPEIIYRSVWLDKQITRLQELFPGLEGANQDLLKKIKNKEIGLPEGVECILIPNIWGKSQKIFGQTYKEAIEKLFSTINQVIGDKFKYNDGVIDCMQLLPSTEKFFRELSETQGNPDILVVPAQFVICHQECGTEAFLVGSMILTHPNFLMDNYHDDVCIYLNGCSPMPNADGTKMVPCFGIDGGEVTFGLGSMKDINSEGKYTHVCSNPFTFNISLSLLSL